MAGTSAAGGCGGLPESELVLGSRDEAFDFGVRDTGKLALLYREHVRYVLFIGCMNDASYWSSARRVLLVDYTVRPIGSLNGTSYWSTVRICPDG